MSYKVIHYFTDLQDFNHAYNVGDIFPRIGMKVSEARLNELSSKNNKQGKPLIELVEDNTKETNENQYTKTDINRMSTADLKKLAKENGIDESMSGAEIKKILIEKFNL